MSELENMRDGRANLRLHLLASVSALALAGLIGLRDAKADDDAVRPTVWIELGGQLERDDSAVSTFIPPFVNMAPPVDRGIMTTAQQAPDYSIGGEAKISFAPEGTDWVFSAAVRYGRANGAKHLHHQTSGIGFLTTFFKGQVFGQKDVALANFSDGQANNEETNLVADFQAGRDVGLGLFSGGSSIVSAGVRFAQFTSKIDATLHAEQGGHKVTYTGIFGGYKFTEYGDPHRSYTATFQAERNTHAVGPSLSWDASLPVTGSDNGMSVALDWGANAAILFGRQRTKSHHQTEGSYHTSHYGRKTVSTYAHMPPDQNRSHFVTIPNVGGFAGLSFQYADAKLALGYRGDFFFGAMDSGIDAAKKENVGFYGPFASISVGIGG
jgi:hypothetical protein